MMTTFEPRLDILPAAQRKLWPELTPVQQHGFVLYGGTAIALRLGHRQSVDFDFFSSWPVDQAKLRAALPFLRHTTVRQDQPNTFEVATKAGVKVSFFGGLDFGRVGEVSAKKFFDTRQLESGSHCWQCASAKRLIGPLSYAS